MAAKNDPDSLITQAAEALSSERASEALRLLEEVLRQSPDHVDAIILKSQALVLMDRWEEGEEWLEQAAFAHPDQAVILLALADMVLSAHPEDGAAVEEARAMSHHCEALAAQAGDNMLLTEARRVQGRALTALGDVSGAVRILEQAYAQSDDDEVLLELAMAWFESLRFDDASRAIAKLQERLPDDARVHHYQGLIHERAGREPQARASFELAEALDPEEFPPPLAVPVEDFSALVNSAIARLPARVRTFLASSSLLVEEIPSEEELRRDAGLSPLSVVALRGQRSGEAAASETWQERPVQIVCFRRNAVRYARHRADVADEIQAGLLSAVGHLVRVDEEGWVEREAD